MPIAAIPFDRLLAALLGVVLVGTLVGSLRMWIYAGVKLVRGEPLLDYEPRRRVPWGLFDLLIIFLLILCVVVGMQWLVAPLISPPADGAAEETSPSSLALLLFSSSLAMLLGCAAAVLVLRVRAGATWEDIGFRARAFWKDLRIGVLAFFMLAPPMYILQFILTKLWFKSEHPVQTMMLEDPNPLVLTTAMFTAVIVAPLTEEIFFRSIFQGWLENGSLLLFRLFGWGYDPKDASTTEVEHDVRALMIGETADQAPLAARVLPDEHHQEDPYAPPYAEEAMPESQGPLVRQAVFPNALAAFMPIAISAQVFALLHANHGPDPIALLFLAIGLGYIYQRTHRIVPCIVLHFCVNGFSTLALLVFLLSGAEPPS